MAARLSPERWLTLVEERAPGLRLAGIESVEIAGCVVRLLPWVPLPDGSKRVAEPEPSSDPLFDPASYPGGIVPGFDLSGLQSRDEEDEP